MTFAFELLAMNQQYNQPGSYRNQCLNYVATVNYIPCIQNFLFKGEDRMSLYIQYLASDCQRKGCQFKRDNKSLFIWQDNAWCDCSLLMSR
jgi:hypothetical protein